MSESRRTFRSGPERPRTVALDRRAFGEPMRSPASRAPAFHAPARDPFVPERGGGAGDLRPRPRPAPERGR